MSFIDSSCFQNLVPNSKSTYAWSICFSDIRPVNLSVCFHDVGLVGAAVTISDETCPVTTSWTLSSIWSGRSYILKERQTCCRASLRTDAQSNGKRHERVLADRQIMHSQRSIVKSRFCCDCRIEKDRSLLVPMKAWKFNLFNSKKNY